MKVIKPKILEFLPEGKHAEILTAVYGSDISCKKLGYAVKIYSSSDVTPSTDITSTPDAIKDFIDRTQVELDKIADHILGITAPRYDSELYAANMVTDGTSSIPIAGTGGRVLNEYRACDRGRNQRLIRGVTDLLKCAQEKTTVTYVIPGMSLQVPISEISTRVRDKVVSSCDTYTINTYCADENTKNVSLYFTKTIEAVP